MLNVFVISSDNRVARLIEHFQPFFKSKIRCATDFDNGLKEVFENRPSVVFIQSTIGTVSGETVSRHIKSLLGSASPRIVFMGDSATSGTKGTSWCDDWILVSDSDQQFQEDFAELISRCFPDAWREISLEMDKAASISGTNAQCSPQAGELTSDAVSEQGGASDSKTDLLGEANTVSVPLKKSGSENEFLSLGPVDNSNDEFPSYQNLYNDPLLASDASTSKRRFNGWFLSVFLMLVVAGSLYYWVLRTGDSTVKLQQPPAVALTKENPDRNASQPTKKKAGIKELPPFIHSEWRDVPYTSQHPGWDRYVSPEIDFRVYRDGGTIKAIQGISRGKNGLSEAGLLQFLKQVGISEPLTAGKTDSENNFLVTTSVLPEVAELVTYREQGGTHIKAFVLELF